MGFSPSLLQNLCALVLSLVLLINSLIYLLNVQFTKEINYFFFFIYVFQKFNIHLRGCRGTLQIEKHGQVGSQNRVNEARAGGRKGNDAPSMMSIIFSMTMMFMMKTVMSIIARTALMTLML